MTQLISERELFVRFQKEAEEKVIDSVVYNYHNGKAEGELFLKGIQFSH
jgi:hypothetical protein